MIFNSPKNFKRGRLINNRWRPIDLAVGIGAAMITLVLLLIYLIGFNGKSPWIAGAMILPAALGITMLVPFNIYHNLMELFRLFLIFRNGKKRYIWEGVYKYDIWKKEEAND